MTQRKWVAPPQWREEINKWLDYLKAAGLSHETIRCRRYKISKMARDMAMTPWQVTTEDLVSWMAVQSWRPETRKAYRNTAVAFFRWLRETGRREDDPAVGIPSVKRPQPQPRPCPDRYIVAALEHADDTERTMIRLAAECGLRRGEIARVHADDVMEDLLGWSLIIRGKGGRQRLVPLPDDLAETIRMCGGWLLPGRWSGHVEESYVSRRISNLLPAGWGPHSLRHRYATRTYEQTHDLYLVARLLGHASVETTQIYVAMPETRLRAALDAVLIG